MPFTQTLTKAYGSFLHPVKKNLGYQNKQPAGVRYIKDVLIEIFFFEINIFHSTILLPYMKTGVQDGVVGLSLYVFNITIHFAHFNTKSR